MKQFEANVTTVMKFLEDESFSTSVISEHRLCYKKLHIYLEASGKCYTPEIAYQWIEDNKASWNHWHYTGYRHCIDQLEDVRLTGSISLNHLSYRKSAYSQLNPVFRSVLDIFIRDYHENDDRYRIACARFLLYLQNNGLGSISELDYDILLQFHKEDYHSSYKTKDVYEDLIRKFLKYLAEKDICSHGLALALNKLLIHQIIRMTDEELCMASGKTYPPVTESLIDGFLAGMAETRYGRTVLKSSRHILTLLYVFLDMHHAVLNDGLLWIWFSRVKPLLGSGWKQHRRSLCQFLYFMETGSIMTGYTGDPQRVRPEELLPNWQIDPLTDYLRLLKHEGWQPSTIAMHRSSNLRLCRYLQDTGIGSFAALTPAVLKDFNLQDHHSTPEGKSAYNCRIRSFIIYLYEQRLIEDPFLFKALPTAAAPKVSVTRTLSKEEVALIWSVDPDALSPKALRDYAMVCIGLSMGFRASDIIGLCFENINWKQRSIRIIQQKTGKILLMPMPIRTGNVLFRYLRDGRPKSNEPFVFICHEAPYSQLHRSVCAKALTRFIGPSAEPGRGFHVVRKTFATQLLEGNTKVELISDSLGHSTDGTVDKYLSLDEKRMRMCPLSLEEAGISYEGGAFHA